jgi:hypothetical protein
MSKDNIERKDSGPAYMDKASDQHYSASTMQAEFMAAVAKGDANALAPWAPLTTDWEAAKKDADPSVRFSTIIGRHKRQQTLSECMSESLDYGDGPSIVEAMHLILNVASGKDESETARRLLERMAACFAYHNED